ncbi:MAG: glycosyltransferase family 2 protein [Elusimicrobia bacterium]|nr:glycosyltransferase family 2 protein [Elusimicrobiota bacterium]
MISVIVPTLNRARSLVRALRCLRGQDLRADGFEVLIVDNRSTDPTRSVAKGFVARHPARRFRYVREEERGLLFGRNRGVEEARGDILAFIDDDIEPAPGWLKAIRRSFADPGVRIVGGPILPRYEARPPAWLEWFWTERPEGRFCAPLGLLDFGDKAREVDPAFVWGGNLAIRREVLVDLGGFHPEYFPGKLWCFEGDGEVGLARKARAAGCKAVYQPEALVRHRIPKGRMTPEYFEKRFFYGGVGESFTRLRDSRGRLEEDRPGGGRRPHRKDRWALRLRERFEKAGAFDPSDRDPGKQALVERFNRAYREGFESHQAAVRRSPALLRWVLKKDYWDYKLPRVRVRGAGRIRRRRF